MPPIVTRGQALAQELLDVSNQLEGEFRREFLDSVQALSRNPKLKKLLGEIDSGQIVSTSTLTARLAQITFDTRVLDAVVRKAMGKSAKLTGKSISLAPSFNVVNPEVVSVARNMSINLSTVLTKSVHETLRKIIQDAVEGNITVIQAARKIRNHVGLIPAHSDAVDRYEANLISRGMNKSTVAKRVEAYSNRLLKYRSEVIARTEVARAVGEGQLAMWKQMVQEGYLPADTKRVWVTALDERTCKICEPMNGQEADIDGYWTTPNGNVVFPSQSHVQCRCTTVVRIGKPSKKGQVTKADDLAIDHYIISKYNTNHDNLGRFSSGTGSKNSSIPKTIQEFKNSKLPDYVLESILSEAKNHDTPESFIRSFSGKSMQGVYTHLTSSKDFSIDPNKKTFAGTHFEQGIFVSSTPEQWKSVMSSKKTNSSQYLAIVTMPNAPKNSYVNTTDRDGHQVFVKPEGLPHIKVHAVVPYQTGVRAYKKINNKVWEILSDGDLVGGGNFRNKLKDIWEYSKSNSVSKYNPHHDELGRFTSGGGKKTKGSTVTGSRKYKNKNITVVDHDTPTPKDLEKLKDFTANDQTSLDDMADSFAGLIFNTVMQVGEKRISAVVSNAVFDTEEDGRPMLHVTGVIRSTDSISPIGEFQRKLFYEEGTVYNDFLKIDKKYQGSGIGTTLMAHWEDQYARAGFTNMEVYAVSSYGSSEYGSRMNGAYTWAKYGYKPSQGSVLSIFNDFQDYISHLGAHNTESWSQRQKAIKILGVDESISSAKLATAMGKHYRTDLLKAMSDYPLLKDLLSGKIYSPYFRETAWHGTKKPKQIGKSFDSLDVVERWMRENPAGLENDDPKFWEEIARSSISKFNPHHDELGRFTSGPNSRAKTRTMSRQKLMELGIGNRSSLIRYSSDARRTAIENLTENGSSKLLMPRNSNTGIAQVLTEAKADKRYGDTAREAVASLRKLGVKKVNVDEGFLRQEDAKRQIHGVTQAIEEAKRMGIPIKDLTVTLTMKLSAEDAVYLSYEGSKYKGEIQYDYQGQARQKGIVRRATAFAQNVQESPLDTVTTYTSDYAQASNPSDQSAMYSYAVVVHEIGHHYTIHNEFNPNVTRQFMSDMTTPALYGNSSIPERLAESFTAWWLLGGSKGKVKTFYKRWHPFVKVVLNGNDDGFVTNPDKLLKSGALIRDVLVVESLPPTHPIIVFLTNGESIPDEVSKFNPYHDELGRFTTASVGGADMSNSTSLTGHSGYEVLPAPTNDVLIAKETGAPLAFLMPDTMDESIKAWYDKQVEQMTETLPSVVQRVSYSQTKLRMDVQKGYLRVLTKKYGFSDEDARTIADGLYIRAYHEAKIKRNINRNYLDRESAQNYAEQYGEGGRSGDEVVVVNVNDTALVRIFSDGRYKTQFESKFSNGVYSPNIRAMQEVASFSLHPSLKPELRPVYGSVHPDGFEETLYESAKQYGVVGIVLDQKKVNSRTSWNEGDSLNQTVTHSSLENPTFHAVSDYTVSPNRWIGDNRWGYGDSASGAYLEAQVHGGVKKSDIKYIVMPKHWTQEQISNLTEKLIKVGVKKSQIKTFEEAINSDLSKKYTQTIMAIPAGAKLFAYNESSKLYSIGLVETKNGLEHLGYVQHDGAEIYKINVDDVYSRGYWTPVGVSKFNPHHDELGRFTSSGGSKTLRINAMPKARPNVKPKSKTSDSTEFHRISDGDEYRMESAQEKIDMTEEEVYAIRNYSSDGYSSVNGYLRNSKKYIEENWRGSAESLALHISNLEKQIGILKGMYDKISVPTPDNFVLFRGLSMPKGKKFKVGSEFTDKGFASTSATHIEASSFATGFSDDGVGRKPLLLEIRVPKGHKVLPMGRRISAYPNESEFLLKNGTRFKVIGVKKTPNDVVKERLVVEIVGD